MNSEDGHGKAPFMVSLSGATWIPERTGFEIEREYEDLDFVKVSQGGTSPSLQLENTTGDGVGVVV